jgi:hypothetical protein
VYSMAGEWSKVAMAAQEAAAPEEEAEEHAAQVQAVAKQQRHEYAERVKAAGVEVAAASEQVLLAANLPSLPLLVYHH